MSFIADLFNGDKGAGFQAQGAPIIQAATKEQADQAFQNTQTGLQQQQAFLQALQAQNGIQNQSDVYNQLQGVANGTGPNPAQAMLAQSTGDNAAQTAALMAGQRGASANTGLIARQAGQAGANAQQQAAGQAATLQAQQSLNAINGAGNIASNQVGNLGGANANYNQFAQGQQQNILGAIANQNNAGVQMQSNMNTANSHIAGINAQKQGDILSGIGGALGKAAMIATMGPAGALAGSLTPGGGAGAAGNVGQTPFFGAEGGQIPSSHTARHLKGIKMASGGEVPIVVSPGEKYLSQSQAMMVANGKENLKDVGKTIPGKAKVKGNSYANDIVPMSGKAGDFVIPKSVMESDNPSKNAAAFVRAHMSQKINSRKK